MRRFRSFPAFMALAAIDKVFYRGPLLLGEARGVRSPLARHLRGVLSKPFGAEQLLRAVRAALSGGGEKGR